MIKSINQLFSLKPLVAVLKKMIAERKPGAKKLYEGLILEIESRPELLQPMYDTAPLAAEPELVEAVLSTIFPPSTTSNQGTYAITVPFDTRTIYASPGFKELFLKGDSTVIDLSDSGTGVDVDRTSLLLAYHLILKKFYAHDTPVAISAVHALRGQDGLTRYYELRLNGQFVDVSLTGEDFRLPEEFSLSPATDPEEWLQALPLKHFRFEGLVVVEVNDVTREQVIAEIKTALLNVNSFSDVSMYDQLQLHVQSLIGQKDVRIGITPFFKLNGCYLYAEGLYKNSLLFSNEAVLREKDRVGELCEASFASSQPLLYDRLDEASVSKDRLLAFYREMGTGSLILCPLKTDEGALVGLLEIVSQQPGYLQLHHIARLVPAIPLFALALEKSGEGLELQIDKMIKEHFTAVQPVVEWKFTQAAFRYLEERRSSEQAKMPDIGFENVYPLFAAIDIRNSSTERNRAIRMDLLEQLNSAKDLLQQASGVIHFPLLDETTFRTEKYITGLSDALLSDDELVIYDFLQNDVGSLLKNLSGRCPELKKWIDGYFDRLDPQRGVHYHHRKEYEESITRINDVLDRFIDNEQAEAQKMYPHYFERYQTDGIEFNIYIGQSLSPHESFDEMYVRNLKLWQLNLLAKAARITHGLKKRLALPLETTQLILAHSVPLSISFRRKERKFDVDGAYNIRYEIVKKRIDKVHLRDSEERLTQPGKIAIVYSHNRELEEYLEFIDYLQQEKLLGQEVEHLDLEDTQGISGLKALRVNVILPVEASPQKPELSRTTSQQLLRK